MTTIPDAELKEAVAKKLGWKIGQRALTMTWWIRPSDNHWCEELPDFPHSLDACEPVFEWCKARGYRVDIEVGQDYTTATIVTGVYPASIAYNPVKSRALCLALLEVEG